MAAKAQRIILHDITELLRSCLTPASSCLISSSRKKTKKKTAEPWSSLEFSGLCPFYSKFYGELDTRNCTDIGSLCPQSDYQSIWTVGKTLYSFIVIKLGLLLSQESTAVLVNVSTCFQPDMSLLYVTCTSKEYYMLHCVLDDDYQPVMSCQKFLRVGAGLCPFYSKVYGELDTRNCTDIGSLCPQSDYQSYEVHKYPGCLNRTLYVPEPPPTTSVTETVTELSGYVTDTFVDKSSNGPNTTLLIVILVLSVVLNCCCLIFFILRKKILKAYKASDRCHIFRRKGKTGKRTESSSPVELQMEPLNGTV